MEPMPLIPKTSEMLLICESLSSLNERVLIVRNNVKQPDRSNRIRRRNLAEQNRRRPANPSRKG
jgi:hypothetical protein